MKKPNRYLNGLKATIDQVQNDTSQAATYNIAHVCSSHDNQDTSLFQV